MVDFKLNEKLRERINESKFICNQYCNIQGKNKWNCICSAMDWIDVGIFNIETALNEFIYAESMQKSIKFYYYITCIDIIWEAIKQLHRVFFETGKIPFHKEKRCFSNNIFNMDDNDYFKEIRACFGAHSVNLDGEIKNEKRFASWSYDFSHQEHEMSITLYSNIPQKEDINLSVSVKQLQYFFEERYAHIEKIIEQIDIIDNKFYNKFRNTPIKISNDPIKQILILIEENKKRLDSEYLEQMLKEIKSFLEVKFICPSNHQKLIEFKEKITYGIDEIRNSLQNIDLSDQMIIANIISPIHRPRENMWGYEFGALHDNIFLGFGKSFIVEDLIEPLKDYIVFDYETLDELYWLIIIALNLAQNDILDNICSPLKNELDILLKINKKGNDMNYET